MVEKRRIEGYPESSDKRRQRQTMTKQTLGNKIAALRKERNMTQAELAQKMGVTDKAVSKWEREL